MLTPVNQRDGDLSAVALLQLRVAVDVDLAKLFTQFGTDRGDDLARHLAEVAALPAEQRDPRFACLLVTHPGIVAQVEGPGPAPATQRRPTLVW